VTFIEPTALRRPLRAGALDQLGRPTPSLLREAIERKDLRTARALVGYLHYEEKFVYDLNRDDAWAWMTYVADRWGEERIFELNWLVFTAAGAVEGRRKLRELPVDEQVAVVAEMMRGHRSGPRDARTLEVVEEPDRFVMSFDPCGSGGRQRRGDPVDGTPPRTEPPFAYGVTKRAYDWSWRRAGVCYYCAHCAIYNELVGIAEYGTPNWVTEYPDDAGAPCRWIFYKRPEVIPERYYHAVGREKPPAAVPTATAEAPPSSSAPVPLAKGLVMSPRLGRPLRLEPAATIGESTLERLAAALEAGKTTEALALLAYYERHEETYQLGGGWRQLDVAAWVADRAGEHAVGDFLRATAESWMRAHIDKLAALSPAERLAFVAELKRAEHGGSGCGDDAVRVSEEHDRFVVTCSPCGDCGRLRRVGAPGVVPRFGVTTQPQSWSWGQAGVPFRCARNCVAFELLPIEWTGRPLWLTEWNADPGQPCRVLVYKGEDTIPASYYERLGHRKP
jgi:hypothetical protein